MFFSRLSPYFIAKVVVLLTLLLNTAAYTIPWVFANSLSKEYSGIDFHGYWYAGHYLRQGVNPYAAILNSPDPVYWDPLVPDSGNPYKPTAPEYALTLPVTYLDGVTVTQPPVAQTMIVVPAMTAPLNLLIGLFSWFSWQTARWLWLALNLIFTAVIPWLALRLVNNRHKLDTLDKWIFALVFYNFYGVRQGLVVGQQTMICLFLLVLALLFHDKWLLSGILLGFGISKYSVGLPAFLYFLRQRNYRSVLVAVIVQVVGILLLVPLKWGSPMDTLSAYLQVFSVNFIQEGVHLSARFADVRLQGFSFGVILVVIVYFMSRQQVPGKTTGLSENAARLNDLNILTLGIFLTTYHRVHDMPFMIFFLLACLVVWIENRDLAIGRFPSIVLALTMTAILSLLLFPTVPGKVIARLEVLSFIPPAWTSLEAFSSIAMLLMLALSAWLYRAPWQGSEFAENVQQGME